MDRLENVIRAHPIFRDYTLAQRAAAVQGQPAPGVDPGKFKRDRLAFVSFLCEKLGAEDLLEHVLSGTKREKEDSSSPSLEIADPTPQELAENLERHLAVFAFLKELSKLEIQDYNQMFFSNLILQPLHPQAGVACPLTRGDEGYAKTLLAQQEALYASVFHREYLQFVGWQKDGADADPADMQVLCFGVALRELLDKTIAAYRKLSEPAVSYRRKKHFLPLLKEAAKVAFDGS